MRNVECKMAVFVRSAICGDLTKAVYECIRDHEYDDAKELLQMELQVDKCTYFKATFYHLVYA